MITGNELRKIVYAYWADRFGCSSGDFAQAGTLIIREEEFDESHWILIYHIDRVSIVRIAQKQVKHVVLPNEFDSEAGTLTATQLQQIVGEKYQTEIVGPFFDNFLYPEVFKPFPVARNYSVRRLFPEKDNPILLAFYDQCTAEDLDEAEIFIDEPDPVIFGMFDGDQMVSYASHRYWGDKIADIGVLVHPNYRSQGLGKAVVSELCQWCIENDVVPMYRVFSGNIHSWHIQKALGFTEMVRIETLRLIQPG